MIFKIHGHSQKLIRDVKTKDFELRATFFGGCGKGGQNGLATGLGGPK